MPQAPQPYIHYPSCCANSPRSWHIQTEDLKIYSPLLEIIFAFIYTSLPGTKLSIRTSFTSGLACFLVVLIKFCRFDANFSRSISISSSWRSSMSQIPAVSQAMPLDWGIKKAKISWCKTWLKGAKCRLSGTQSTPRPSNWIHHSATSKIRLGGTNCVSLRDARLSDLPISWVISERLS